MIVSWLPYSLRAQLLNDKFTGLHLAHAQPTISPCAL